MEGRPYSRIPTRNTNAQPQPVIISPNQTPVPVSITSGDITGFSTAANQTNGNQKTQIVDGSGNVIASTSNALNVQIQNTSIAVTGSVTANAGTNLNTSALALESGGNLDAIETDVDTLAGAVSGALFQNNVSTIATVTPTLGDVNNAAAITGVLNVTPVVRYNATQPTLTDTRYNLLQVSVRGELLVSPGVSNFAVQATLASETTKVIGTVNQGTSPWVISGAITEATLDAALISQEATTSGVKGLTIFGAVTTNKPTYATAKSDALSLDVNGLLRVSLADTPANTNKFLVTADAITFASPQHIIADSGTITTVSTVSNLSQIATVVPTFGDINNSATETGTLDVAPIGRYNATLPTITDTRYNQFQVGLRGALQVNLLNTDGTATQFLASAALADAAAANPTTTTVGNIPLLMNATTVDRARAVINTLDSTGIGIQAVGVIGQFDDVSPTAATENKFDPIRISSRREMYVQIRDAAGNERGINVDANGGIPITIEAAQTLATVTTVSTVTTITNAVNTNADSSLDTTTVPGKMFVIGGESNDATAQYNPIPLGAGGRTVIVEGFGGGTAVPVSLAANQSVNVAQINGHTTVEGGANGVLAVGGKDASGASTTTNPVQVGALSGTALPTAVSTAQVVEYMADKFGRQVVLPVTIRDLTGTQTTTLSNTTSETTIVSQAASVFNDLLMLVLSNTSATATRVDFRDTTGGTILFSLYAPAADTRGFSLGGVAIPQTSVNTNWTAQCGTAIVDLRVYAVWAKNR